MRRFIFCIPVVFLDSAFALPATAEDETTSSATTLPAVVVSGESLNPLKIPVKMTVITEEEIKAKGAHTVDEALKDVAGLYVTGSNVKGRKVAQIRGSDANSTKVIIDGVTLNSDGDARRDLSTIPTDNIEKIEIFKGVAPVIYGTNAPGGVIFITTKKNTGKTSGSLGITRGSWNTEMYSLSLGGGVGDVSYYVGAKTSSTDGYNDNPNNIGGYKKNTAEDARFYNGKLVWSINPDASLSVFGSYSDITRQLPNRYDATTRLTYPGGGSSLTTQNNYFGGGATGSIPSATYNWAYQPIQEAYYGSVYKQKLNENNEISFKVYRSELQSMLTTKGSVPAYSFQSVDWDGSTTGYELQQTISPRKSVALTWGYSNETRRLAEKTPLDASRTRYATGDYNYTGTSYFLQAVLNVSSQLDISAGYRHNSVRDHLVVKNVLWTQPASREQNGDYSSNDPVLALNYRPIEGIALRASAGKSFRAPTAMERSAPLLAPVAQLPLPYYGPTVLPERGLNRELGVEVATNFGMGLGVTYFNRSITNMIKGAGAGGGHTQYFNIPDVEMHGFEAEVSQSLGTRIKGFANYSYTNAYDKLMKTQVADIPLNKFSYGLNYTHDGLTANLAVNYVGPVRSMYSQGSGNGSSDGNYSNVISGVNTYYGTQSLPGYHLVDLKVSKALGNTDFYVKVLNLLNHQYYTAAYLAAPGRYGEVGMTVKF